MIRLFTALCKAALKNFTETEYDLFRDASDNFSHYSERCPACGACGKLSYYGDYGRGLVSYESMQTTDYRIRPKRFICASCGTTHALLPDIIAPHSPYSVRFKLSALIGYFDRETTVEAVCRHFGIAVSTLYTWKRDLISHKGLFLGALANIKVSALDFIRGLLSSGCISERSCDFFRKYAISFLQHTPGKATRSCPP